MVLFSSLLLFLLSLLLSSEAAGLPAAYPTILGP